MVQVLGVLQREASRCEELLEVEIDRRRCKWPLLTLAHVLELQLQLGENAAARERRGQLLTELAALDPLRRGFYTDAMKKHSACCQQVETAIQCNACRSRSAQAVEMQVLETVPSCEPNQQVK